MNSKNGKLLTKMLGQFKTAHEGALPRRIVVEPLALIALGIKREAVAVLEGVPVTCLEIEQKDVRKPGLGTSLAVLLDSKTHHLVASDIAD
jgi:hypothetical protein